MNILEIENLHISFMIDTKGFKQKKLDVVQDVNLNLKRGEILTIVGSSGSGKSVFATSMFDILGDNATITGKIIYDGKSVDNLINRAIYIPQSSSFLDPLIKVENQVKLTNNKLSNKTRGLYPFECSGGMIRNAFFELVHEQNNIDIIIADEPTPGMDIEKALESLKALRDYANKGKSVILITHDIDLALDLSDRIAVFYDGTIVEIANVSDFTNGKIRHHYTKALFRALPQNEFKAIDFTTSKDKCFCSNMCHKYNEKCNEALSFVEINDGYVRCNNAPLW